MPHTRTLLVIDDDPDTADTLALLLASEGCDCRVAYGGERGLALARTLRPDVVIVDLAMPVVDGFHVARVLRDELSERPTLLVAHTSLAGPDEIDDALEAGFDRLLVKPASMDELLALARGDLPAQFPGSDAPSIVPPRGRPPLSMGAG